MKFRTICLAPGRAAPGMTLAATVTDRHARTLLSAGTVLDSTLIDRLSRRGVDVVWVSIPDTRDPAIIAQSLVGAEARVAQIFRGPGSPAREALQAEILRFRQESLQ